MPVNAKFMAADIFMKTILVVAAVLTKDNMVLLTRRPEGKDFAGLWEFPGGKIEPDETPEAALTRELEEEIGIYADKFTPLGFVSHAYTHKHVTILFFSCKQWKGEIIPQEHQEAKWFHHSELHTVPVPEADIPIIKLLGSTS